MTYIVNYQNGNTESLSNAENYCAYDGVCHKAGGNHILEGECPESSTLHSTLSYISDMSGETEVTYMSCCIPNSVA